MQEIQKSFLDHRCQAIGKQGPPLAQVDDVEDDALVPLSVLNRKMEPESGTGVGRVGTDKQIVLLICDKVHATQIHRFVTTIETNMTFLGFTRMPWWPYNQPLNVIENA